MCLVPLLAAVLRTHAIWTTLRTISFRKDPKIDLKYFQQTDQSKQWSWRPICEMSLKVRINLLYFPFCCDTVPALWQDNVLSRDLLLLLLLSCSNEQQWPFQWWWLCNLAIDYLFSIICCTIIETCTWLYPKMICLTWSSIHFAIHPISLFGFEWGICLSTFFILFL